MPPRVEVRSYPSSEARVPVAPARPEAFAPSTKRDRFVHLRLLRAGAPAHAEVWLIDYAGQPAVLKSYAHGGWLFRTIAGAHLIRREAAAYRRLDGVMGVPRLLARMGRDALVVEHIEGRNCTADAPRPLDADFFAALSDILRASRAHGVLHGDVKRNVLCAGDGRPWLVDFGASFVIGAWLRPLRPLILRVAAVYDQRTVAKLKRQIAPQLLTADELRLLDARLPFEGTVKRGERLLRWGTQWIKRRESRRSAVRV